MMRVLGLIPARGGSKGVPRKNVRLLLGKPLLQYTAEAALDAKRLCRIVLTTDDEEIAEIGRACGLDVPFMRPPELAEDETPTLPVVQHAVRLLEEQGEHYDAVCLLQPTNPLRLPSDIDGAIQLMEERNADSVIAFCDVGENHPARMKYVAEDGRVSDPPFAEAMEGQRRQDLPTLYRREGSIYLTKRSIVMNEGSFRGSLCFAWMIPPSRGCNVDTELDLILAEAMLKNLVSLPDH